jgi:hypothetical protein
VCYSQRLGLLQTNHRPLHGCTVSYVLVRTSKTRPDRMERNPIRLFILRNEPNSGKTLEFYAHRKHELRSLNRSRFHRAGLPEGPAD